MRYLSLFQPHPNSLASPDFPRTLLPLFLLNTSLLPPPCSTRHPQQPWMWATWLSSCPSCTGQTEFTLETWRGKGEKWGRVDEEGRKRERRREKKELRKRWLLVGHPCSPSFFSHLKTLPKIISSYLKKQKHPLTYDIIWANLISDEKLIYRLHFRALGEVGMEG